MPYTKQTRKQVILWIVWQRLCGREYSGRRCQMDRYFWGECWPRRQDTLFCGTYQDWENYGAVTAVEFILIALLRAISLATKWFCHFSNYEFHVYRWRISYFQLQEIMEKFEFFPIKCRVQRATEIFKRNGQEHKQKLLNLKVYKLVVVCEICSSFKYTSNGEWQHLWTHMWQLHILQSMRVDLFDFSRRWEMSLCLRMTVPDW